MSTKVEWVSFTAKSVRPQLTQQQQQMEGDGMELKKKEEEVEDVRGEEKRRGGRRNSTSWTVFPGQGECECVCVGGRGSLISVEKQWAYFRLRYHEDMDRPGLRAPLQVSES